MSDQVAMTRDMLGGIISMLGSVRLLAHVLGQIAFAYLISFEVHNLAQIYAVRGRAAIIRTCYFQRQRARAATPTSRAYRRAKVTNLRPAELNARSELNRIW